MNNKPKMTKLLEKAFVEASKLPKEEQNAIAELLLAEITSEQRWAKLFKESAESLAKLAKEALEEYRVSTN